MYGMIIADDEDIVRRGLCKNVKWAKYGFEVVGEACNGQETMKLVRKLRPQLLLTDIRMPDMLGLDVLKQIKGEQLDTQVVMLSAYDLFDYAREALMYGAVGYLLKPLEESELDMVMEKVQENIKHKKLSGVKQTSVEREIDSIELVRQYVIDHYAEALTLKDLATMFYMPATYLSSKFKSKTGCNFVDFLVDIRMKKAKELLLYSDRRIPEIASMVGYDDYTYFCKVFKKTTGYTPLAYRCTNTGDI